MADNLPDNQKPYQPPQPFEYKQPDIVSSTAEASSQAFEKKKKEEETKQQETGKEQEKPGLSPEEQGKISPGFNQKKQERKISTKEEEAAKTAAAAATKMPGAGWLIKLAAILIRLLKAVFGEQIAAFLTVWLILSSAFFFFNVLPIVGTIFFIIVPPAAALVITPIVWPKIKPFVEAAGKINVIPNKK
jgi:hypothetical protein